MSINDKLLPIENYIDMFFPVEPDKKRLSNEMKKKEIHTRIYISDMLQHTLMYKISVNELETYYSVLNAAIEAKIISTKRKRNLPVSEEEFCLFVLSCAVVLRLNSNDKENFAAIKEKIDDQLKDIRLNKRKKVLKKEKNLK